MRISIMFLPKLICSLLLLLVSTRVFSQSNPTIRASVDKNKIILGESFVLTVEVQLPAGTKNTFKEIDTIPHFEFVGEPVIDSSTSGNGTSIKGLYTLTSFDSGHWVIPSFVLSRNIQSDTLPIDVVFTDFNPDQPYHDIKDIINVRPRAQKQWWWYVIGGALLLGLLVLYLVRRKKAPIVQKPGRSIDPYEEALTELDQLHRSKPEARQYYTRLVDIFRLYIFRRKNILSLQKTTDDLVIQMKGLGLDTDQYKKLSQALRMADFVKFAKYVPGADDDTATYKDIRNAIVTIEEKSKPVIEEPKNKES
jgi:LPXTG-motif cell wall-anchored protein